MLDMLARLSDGSYSGLSAEGLSGEDPIPVLEGTITVHSKYYRDTVDALRSVFNRLNLVLVGEAAIHFKDAEARRICLGVWDADKDGYITEEEAAVQRAISASTFANNTRIVSFNEFKWLNFTTSSIICLPDVRLCKVSNCRKTGISDTNTFTDASLWKDA